MEKQVVRTVKYGTIKYLTIMDESIAKLENGSKVQYGNHYTVLCDHDENIDTKECICYTQLTICKSDVFCLPTVDDYIKLGILLRLHRKRFNLKKNEIITLKNVQK